MHRTIPGTCLLLCFLWLGQPAHAQETQVPLDEEGRIEAIDARLAGQLGLFVDEYPGFTEARLFEAAEGSFVLEISLRRDGRLVRERQNLSAGEAEELRMMVSRRVVERAPAAALDQDGRFLLLGQTTFLGLGFYGWAIPTMLNVQDATSFGGSYLLTASGSFFVPFLLTQGQPVSYGMANLSRSGATRGVTHGFLLYSLLAGPPTLSRQDQGRARLAAGVVTSMAEGVGGYLWARDEAMDPGTSATLANGSDLGLLWGSGVSGVLGDDNFENRLPAGLALTGAVLGVEGGRRLAARRDFTWGDANVMRTGGALGTYGALAAADLLGAEDRRIFWGSAVLGSAAGGVLSDRMLDGRNFSVGQSVLVQLGTLAGGLTGLGVATLGEGSATTFLTMGAVGATAGFAATFAALAPEATASSGDGVPRFNVGVVPGAVSGAGGAGLRSMRLSATAGWRF